jgi:thiol-disulfide isomerase/thioredoxin
MREIRARIGVVAALLLVLSAGAALAEGDWNDGEIAWHGYVDGLKAAKQAGKPICLVFYTDWCPHCKTYSKVFHSEQVVERSRSFVMIRVNKDVEPKLSAQFSADGQYIPRTYFLSATGEHAAGIHAPRDKYKYFWNTADPASLLGGMQRALDELK